MAKYRIVDLKGTDDYLMCCRYKVEKYYPNHINVNRGWIICDYARTLKKARAIIENKKTPKTMPVIVYEE